MRRTDRPGRRYGYAAMADDDWRLRIELDEDGSGWAQTRMLVAWLAHAGYVAQVLIGPEPKVLALTGHPLIPAEREAFRQRWGSPDHVAAMKAFRERK